ncbi:MAG: hypothetical protein FD123_2348 [Bacteroidetes bacterium]|nr:MAG: hypothetical protein FD123_2348 [Bacteroidota bacterium]
MIKKEHERKKMDLRELRELSSGDEQFFHDMIRTFIRTMREGLVLMRQAMEQSDWNSVADHAHKMRGPCSHLGMEDLWEILNTIEENITAFSDRKEVPALVSRAEMEAELVIKLLQEETKV